MTRVSTTRSIARVLGAFIIAGLLSCMISGCTKTTAIQLRIESATSFSFHSMWLHVAKQGGFNAETAKLAQLLVGFSRSGVPLHVSIRALAEDGRMVQVGFERFNLPDGGPITVSGSVTPAPNQSLTELIGRENIAPILEAIDTIGTREFVAPLGSAGCDGYYEISSASPSESEHRLIPAGAAAYWWNGSGFAALAPSDSRRTLDAGNVCVVGYPTAPVSTSRAASQVDHTVVSQYQGAGTPVYFVLPTR